MTLHVLYTSTAHSEGGRNGSTRNADGLVNVKLSVPKAMGGPGLPGTTTPEDLFAAGYAACFGSACDYAAKSILKLKPTSIAIDCEVAIGTNESGKFGFKVGRTATIAGLEPADAERLVETADTICPYSNAIRKNVEVNLSVKTAK